MKFFDFDRKKGRLNVLVQEHVRRNAPDELKLPQNKNLFMFVAGDKIDSDAFDVSSEKHRLISAIDRSKFPKAASELIASTEWFQLMPAEWVVSEFEPLLERLPVLESVKQAILQAKKLVRIQVTEQFGSSLDGLQLLNFMTAQFARNVEGIVFEPCSFKLYHFTDPALKQFAQFEMGIPSLFPFLSTLLSKKGGCYRLTGHGLARFDLPEFELDIIEQSMCTPAAYLLNAMAQSLVEKVVESRIKNLVTFPLQEPFSVSTDSVVRGNKGDVPFDACVPRIERVPLKLNIDNGFAKLIIKFEANGEKQDEALESVLTKLSLI